MTECSQGCELIQPFPKRRMRLIKPLLLTNGRYRLTNKTGA